MAPWVCFGYIIRSSQNGVSVDNVNFQCEMKSLDEKGDGPWGHFTLELEEPQHVMYMLCDWSRCGDGSSSLYTRL